jgi:ligand-binding sensor domain-containing protein
MKYYPKLSIFIAILLLVFYFVPQQSPNVEAASDSQYKFDRLTIDQGLSHSRVYSMIKDSYGYMWFGTEYGLNKFDGLNFTVYENSQADTQSISNNFARTVYEDSYGTIWIATTHGLNRFNRETETFTYYFNDPSDINSISDDSIEFCAIDEDKYGFLWVGTDNGLNRFDRETETFTRYFHEPDNPNSISSNTIAQIFKDSYGVLWIGPSFGLNRYEETTGNFFRY